MPRAGRRRWLPSKRNYEFLRALTWRSRLIVMSAVFFTFGSMGFLQDMMNLDSLYTIPRLVIVVFFNGLIAVMILSAVALRRTLIPVVAVLAFALPYVANRLFPHSPHIMPTDLNALQHRLEVEAIICVFFVLAGYGFFIYYIRTEGTRQLRLRTEIALAERIHSTLVPPVAMTTPRLELLGRSEPSSEVEGDLLDVVERRGEILACVADVSGHGVAAGSFMGMTKSAIRMKLLSSSALDALLDDLDEVVTQLRSPGMFVTFAGIRFDDSNTAAVALAGHLPVLRWRKSTGTIELIENHCPPLGVVAGQRHTSARVEFAAGDLFVLLTDGLTEIQSRGNVEFGLAGVLRVLERHVHAPLATLYHELLDAARAHGPQTDDQTLLLVRIR